MVPGSIPGGPTNDIKDLRKRIRPGFALSVRVLCGISFFVLAGLLHVVHVRFGRQLST